MNMMRDKARLFRVLTFSGPVLLVVVHIFAVVAVLSFGRRAGAYPYTSGRDSALRDTGVTGRTWTVPAISSDRRLTFSAFTLAFSAGAGEFPVLDRSGWPLCAV